LVNDIVGHYNRRFFIMAPHEMEQLNGKIKKDEQRYIWKAGRRGL